jgi:hypothetical protein
VLYKRETGTRVVECLDLEERTNKIMRVRVYYGDVC